MPLMYGMGVCVPLGPNGMHGIPTVFPPLFSPLFVFLILDLSPLSMALLAEFSTNWVGLNHLESEGFGLSRKEEEAFQVGKKKNASERRNHVAHNVETGGAGAAGSRGGW